MSGYFITGTDTGVGKTMVTALLANLLQAQGRKVAAYKPAESGGRKEGEQYRSLDMEFVSKYTGLNQPASEMNSYCFKNAVSPHLAAEMAQEQIDLDLIQNHFNYLKTKYDLVLVEGAGGICVPICGTEVLIADLIKMLNLPLIVVARPGLGTINHTVLTVKYAQNMGLTVKGVIINYAQDIVDTIVEKTNPKYIEQVAGVPILGIVPYINLPEQAAKLATPELYLRYEKILGNA